MSQTLTKGLRILEALAHSNQPRGITELARMLDMNQSAVQRLINTLVKQGYARQAEGTRKYRLTYSLWELGQRSVEDSALRRLLRPTLLLGAHVTGMTCFFAMESFPFVVYFDRVEGRRGRPHSAEPGRKVPMTATASGKAIFPYLPARRRAQLAQPATDWTGFVPFPGLDLDVIEEVVQQVRRDRYAWSVSGMRKGMNSVAAPVWSKAPEPLGAIVLTSSETELRVEEFPSYGAHVLELAEEATVSLGGAAFRNTAELGPH
ncbi:IclR family transcriptional regulator [Alkalilacustris brevis]|uniref:IclR family transcriptional regulator n=1 Tax=Alkalilacustris brevis TaxID=2026338 RepID=UPI0013905D40|nr:IclR family transcriptional regulator [Alkalilacustris brevis]